jgi:hypothetical protein
MANDRKTDLPPSDARRGTCPWRPCSDHWRDDVKKRAVISLESLAPSATDAITVIARCVDSPPIIVQTVFSTVRAPVLANDVVEHLVIGLKWSRCCGDRSPDRPAPARCVPSANHWGDDVAGVFGGSGKRSGSMSSTWWKHWQSTAARTILWSSGDCPSIMARR